MKRGVKYPVQPLTRDEIDRLLSACNKGATGTRNRALIVVMWRAGLRVSEALALVPGNVEERSLRVLHGKGDKCRVVGMDAVCKAVLDVWMAERRSLGFGNREPIFCTLKGEGLKTSYVRSLMKRLAATARIEKRVHPHQLRHTMAFELIGEGVRLDVISGQLGHSNLSVTEAYLAHLNPRVIVDVISARA